jgi:hypothetical protein
MLRISRHCNQSWIFSTDFHTNPPVPNLTAIRPVGAWLIHADGQTDVKKLGFKLPPRFLNVIFFLLGNSPAYEFYMPTFRNTLFRLRRCCKQVDLPAYKTYENGTDRVIRNVGV